MKSSKKNILQTYLNRLTNLTGNNRSILLLRLAKEQMIDLQDFNFLTGDSFSILTGLMSGRRNKLCQVLDSRVEANNEISNRIKRLQRVDKFIYEERGSNDLHVGWPFVRGKFSDGTLVRAPLLFFPVSIEQNSNHWELVPRDNAGITINKSFALAYSFFNKVELPEELLEATFDEFNSDSTVWRTELYQLLKDRIELNFNPDNFRDELVKFEEFDKGSFKEKHGAGEIKLYPEAVLGIFPQAGSQLLPDYTYLLEAENFQDLEEFFIKRNATHQSGEGEVMNNPISIKEESLFTPFEIDAWQENAIKIIKAGNSIVAQGPPGTGKSQLICNLISDAIASGKKVLVVCQKRAALDVVFQRLHEIDLEDFIGLVHDFRNDRNEIFAKIARQIDRIEDYKAIDRTVDIIQMERRFLQLCRNIDLIVEELDEFKRALFSDEDSGLSIKELYLNSDPNGASINLKQEFQFFHYSGVNEFIRKLKSYTNYAKIFEKDGYAWKHRQSFSGLKLTDMKALVQVIHDIPEYHKWLSEKISSIIPPVINIDDAHTLFNREDDILGMLSVLKDEETYRYFVAMAGENDEETSLLWLSNVERVTMNCYENEGPEKTVASEELGRLQAALHQSIAAKRSLIRLIRWYWSENNYWIKRVVIANGLPFNKAGLRALEQKLDSRLNLEHHLTSLKERPWLIELPQSYERDEFKQWFERKKLAIRAKLVFNSLKEIKDFIKPNEYTRKEFIKLFYDLLKVFSDIPRKKKEWQRYLSPFQIRHIIREPAIAEEYASTLKTDFDNLCAFDKLRETLSDSELDTIKKLQSQLNVWEFEKLESLFVNSLALAWIDYIETKYPVLRIVSSMRIEELQAELSQLVGEKKKLSKEIILLRAREHLYSELEYNRLNNRITYRDLHHQVTKKKKLWPLRKVMNEMQNDLLKLIPCWLASPESVSAIFPMREVFDLVIFDEASQCFAERGIPAMYRGKQIVIAGDDKQLKPYELYQVRWDDETDHPDSEVDSLLELAERYLQSIYLQGHYRSQSPELIDFSNKHFYEGRLKLLPDRLRLNRHEPAIEFHKVEGYWENNVNAIEAEEVVNKVLYFVREFPKLEIGVVTFNAPQQMLIMDRLEEEFLKDGLTIPSTLFVKNIENVQGDEKDIIIFSIGYARDKKGKMVMQFGSLNLPGGENRLNVAITRARVQVIIVSSILPEDLKVEESRNEGPKLLKAYLEFARQVNKGEFTPKDYQPEKQESSWYLKTKMKEVARLRFPSMMFETNAMPFTDVCFRQNGNYLGALLTDDERYLNSLSAKDLYAYTMDQLSRKHWEHRMIYSRNYWLDRERVEDELLRLVGGQMG
ncbi:MAG TPA: AAA domain-containing protein [Cyclobacteriaceae bacterium]|nr:AAA domain-containing protein [Cyclobacteriaceae bacterium]